MLRRLVPEVQTCYDVLTVVILISVQDLPIVSVEHLVCLQNRQLLELSLRTSLVDEWSMRIFFAVMI